MANKNYMLNDKFPKAIKNATSTSDGLMSALDKSRLDSVFEFGQLTPSAPDKDGLMSKEDKAKLDSIEEGANNYIHPDSHDASMIVQDSSHRFITDEQIAYWNSKSDSTVTSDIATQTANGLMSKEDKAKLDGIDINANNYIHPDSHNATMIIEDETHRFVTDEEKAIWNSGSNIGEVSTTTNGLMTKEDKTKLDSIAEGANKYTHPANHLATMITEDTTHRFVTDEEKAAWNAKATTALATQTANGLMSATDKKKLDSISSNANNYTHPDTHPATMIIEDSTHRFVTDAEKTTWNNKASTTTATTSTNGLMSAADKKKLDSTITTIATTSSNGLMSSSDKTNLQNLLTRMSAVETQQAEMLAKLKTAVFI